MNIPNWKFLVSSHQKLTLYFLYNWHVKTLEVLPYFLQTLHKIILLNLWEMIFPFFIGKFSLYSDLLLLLKESFHYWYY